MKVVEPSWKVMAHGDARKGKWRGNWRLEWVASTLHTTSEHGVSSITTDDAHTTAASSRLNWCPCRFKWTRPFRRKTKSGFCMCAITFQMQSTQFACFTGRITPSLSLQALGTKIFLNPCCPYQRFTYPENRNSYPSFTYRVTFERIEQVAADSRHGVVL